MTWISTPRGLYGESGIRTHGTLTSTHAFQACTFGHSVISPSPWMGEGRLRTWMYKQTPSQHHGLPARFRAPAAQGMVRGRRVHGRRTRRTGTPVRTSDYQGTGRRNRRTGIPHMCRGRRRHGGRKTPQNHHTTHNNLAERVGFEPTEPQAAQRFSRPPDSTALASLQAHGWAKGGCVHGCTSRRPVSATMARGRRVHGRTQRRPDPWMGEGRLRTCRRPTSIDSTRSSPAPAGDDLAIRAQEDSNLRPLDPQSNALSRLSYGHIPVSPFVHPCTRARLAIHAEYRGRSPERGGFEPPVPFRGTTP